MYTKSSYTKLTEDRIDKNEKKSNWEVAIGLNEVDSLKPSKYLIELMQDSIEGKKSYKEVENALYSYYKELDPNDEAILQTEECDLVSVRIVQLLENGSFKFSPITLKTIHRALFKDLFKGELERYVGEFRDYNISKKEPILGGDSVIYSDYNDLMDILALFKDLFKGELERYVGEFRDYNISKKEPILGGDSVIYSDYNDLMDILTYDFEEESKKSAKVSISRLGKQKKCKGIYKQTSKIYFFYMASTSIL